LEYKDLLCFAVNFSYILNVAFLFQAALIHDVDHSGVSNAQLIKEGAKIADVFKQKSVAEQNSIVLAWDRLMESRFTVLRGCIYSDPEELKRFRQLMVNTVMATDIFDKELQALRKNRWDTAFNIGEANQTRKSTIEDDRNRKATIVIEHLIQASDVAHTMQHWHIYQKWNERLFAEMMHAYQHDRLGFNPAEGWYKGEIGFFDNYIIPLAKKLKECGVFGVSSDEYLNYAMENRREWAMKGEDVVKKMIAKYSTTKGEVAAPASPVVAAAVPAAKEA
jgi:3'5'-cyclic nucleotide phosphodiesterase